MERALDRMASSAGRLLLALGVWAWLFPQAYAQAARTIPETDVTTLSGQHLSLPKDLPAPATVFILGFGRSSQQATTAWERPTRTQLAKPGVVSFYDMAMLAEIPSVLRPLILRAIKHKVPDVLQPNFVPLTEDEDKWKRAAGFEEAQTDAAYVLVVDRRGIVRWSTHISFSPAAFSELRKQTEEVTRETY